MEEENKQEVQPEVNQEVKNETKKFDLKKYLPIIGGVVAVVLLIIILVAVFGGGPKKAVKNFVSGMNSQNASKIIKSMDFAGMAAWELSYYDVDDFTEDDYDEFIEAYEDIDKDEIKDATEYMEDIMDDSFDEIDDEYKSYKIKVEEFKSKEELGKDLYAVKAKISVQAKPEDEDETDEIDEAEIVTFVVYKNKLISLGEIGF